MKKLENKTKLSTIALILVLTLSAILVALPAATAQDPEIKTRKTYAFLGAVPNPVGVNQMVLLHVGITDYLLIAEDGWEGLTVSVVDPEGIESTLGPIRTDSTGGTGFAFTPTKIGTYTLQTNFPAQEYNWTSPPAFDFSLSGLILYEASTSEPVELIVQEESIGYYPGHSLPDEYWTRPIDAQLREWSTIAGSSWETDYNEAPETAHILWVTPLAIGGVAGGSTGDHAFDCGDAYAGKWGGGFFDPGGGPIIIAGILISRTDPVVDPAQTIARDVRTGEELWRCDFTFNFGQIYYHSSFNRHAAYAYIWRTIGGGGFPFFAPPTAMMAYDPYTGYWAYNITNLPSGTRTVGPNGELLYYSVSLRDGTMSLWNSSWAYMEGKAGMDQAWNALGTTVNASERGHQWTIDIPADLPGSVASVDITDRVIGFDTSEDGTDVTVWAFSLKPGQEGDLLYKRTAQNPASASIAAGFFGESLLSVEDGVFIRWYKDLRQYWGYSLETGELLWGPTESENYQNIYDHGATIAYGKLYSTGCSGVVYCYDLTTGELLWAYENVDPFQEILWSNTWWSGILFITDGKIYLGHEEHSVIDPKPRGAPFTCLDAETGDVIWRANGLFRQTHWGSTGIIGESVIVTMDTYDQRIYAIGKGPSATTATASPKVSVHGSSVLIEGTVMDVSPGTNDLRLTLRFANGVPAISDESMSDWMLHVYKQFPRPAAATGVTVTLETIDPNGNYQYLGTATTDTSGKYGFAFEPEVPGLYLILATFYGSAGYYASTTTTYIVVDQAPSPAQQIEPEPAAPEPTEPEATEPEATEPLTTQPDPNEPEPTEPTTASVITTEQTILAAVAISFVVGAVSFWGLRKQRK